MENAPTTTVNTIFGVFSVLMALAGISAGLLLAFLAQTRRLKHFLPPRSDMRAQIFTAIHAKIILAVTLFFALAVALAPDGTAPPEAHRLIGNALFYAVFCLTAVGACLLNARITFKQAFLSRKCSPKRALTLGVVFGLAVIPPVTVVSILVQTLLGVAGIESQPQELFQWLQESQATGLKLFMMFSAVIMAPIVEELLFRGVLFRAALVGRSFIFTALLNATWFALVHLHAPSVVPLLLLSIAFSAGYVATGSILTPIAMHVLFNLTSLAFYLATS